MTSLPTVAAAPPERAPHRVRLARRAAVGAVALVLALLAMPVHPASADATFNGRLLELLNRDRAANGLWALVSEPTLASMAEDAPYNGCGYTVRGRARDMGERNYFSHTIQNCASQSVFNIINSTNLVINGAGENIGWMSGTTDPLAAAENIHKQLMNSPTHRANILSTMFTKVGIGSWHTASGQTWSGGGGNASNVFITAQVFAGGPVDPTPTTTPPTTAAPTTTTPTTTAPTTTPTTAAPTGPTGRYTPLTPARILDTRDGTGGIAGPVPSGGTIDVQIAGRGGIPTSDVAAVAMTVTVTQPTAAGYMTAFPSGTARPAPSNLNFAAGETTGNLVVAKVGTGGKVSLFNSFGATHVVIDVAGWYSGATSGSAGRFEPVQPSRLLDTRTGIGGGVRLGPGGSLDLQVTGRGGVPSAGVQAAVLNLTVTGTTADSFLTAYPTGVARPWASSLNFGPGATVAERSVVKLGSGGKVTIFNGAGSTDVIVDVSGWYTDSSTTGSLGALVPVAPARILDTRDGTGGIAGPVPSGGSVDVQVTGRGGVPSSGARAVILNVTVTQPVAAGYLTIFPAGTARPLSSDVNFAAGDNQPNLVVVQLGSGGKVSVFASAGTHVIFDVAGWIS